MATGFHIATLGMTVRNFLALKGPSHPVGIAAELRVLYHPDFDEEEARRALGALVKRGMVQAIGADRYAATDKAIFRHRLHGHGAMREDDERAWQGWSP